MSSEKTYAYAIETGLRNMGEHDTAMIVLGPAHFAEMLAEHTVGDGAYVQIAPLVPNLRRLADVADGLDESTAGRVAGITADYAAGVQDLARALSGDIPTDRMALIFARILEEG